MRRRQWQLSLACGSLVVSAFGCLGVQMTSSEVAVVEEVLAGAEPAAPPPATQPAPEQPSPPQLTAAALTLRQCLEWTLQNNLQLSVERLTPDVRDAQIVEALSAFEALFTGGYSFSQDEQPTASTLSGATALESDVNAAQVGLRKRLLTGAQARLALDWNQLDTNSVFATLNPHSEASVAAELTQPLLRDFGVAVNTASIRIARNTKMGSVHLFRKAVEETLAAVEEVYWSLYLAIEELQVRRRQLQRAVDLLNRAKKFVEAGTAAPVEAISAEAEVARVTSDIVNAENAVRRGEDALKRLINRPDLPLGSPTRLIPADGPSDLPVTVAPAVAVAAALRNRPDLKAAELEQANAHIRLKAARNQLLPRLDLGLTYGLRGLDRYPERSLDELTQFEFHEVRASLTAQIPIGNQFARSRCEQARLLREQTRLSTADLRQQIIFEITRALDDLRTDRERIRAAREATRLARERLKDEEALYRHERSTRTDLLQAQTSLAERELVEIQAVITFNVNRARFQRVQGTYLKHNNIEIEAVPGN